MAIEESDKIKARVSVIKKSIGRKGKEKTKLSYEIGALKDELLGIQDLCNHHPFRDTLECGICGKKLNR